MKPLLFAILALPLAAAELPRGDLKLLTGATLRDARIVGITGEVVSIVHAGGATSVDASEVPLDVLARSHMALEAKAAERKKETAEIAARVAAADAVAAKDREQELRIRLAEANARARAQGGEEVKPPATRQSRPAAGGSSLIALKNAFPALQKEKVSVDIGGRAERIEIDVPHVDVWTKYRSSVLSASAASAPIVAAKLETDLAADLANWTERTKSVSGQSAKEQARRTVAWLNQLRPYLAQLKALRP